MLRRIAGSGCRPDKLWVDWVKRSTRRALAAAKDAGIRFWQHDHLKSKWCWAGHVLRMSPERIACRAVVWRDSRWQAVENTWPAQMRVRRPGRKRWFRWEDELHKYASRQHWSSWQEVAQERDEKGQAARWLDHATDFIKCTV